MGLRTVTERRGTTLRYILFSVYTNTLQDIEEAFPGIDEAVPAYILSAVVACFITFSSFTLTQASTTASLTQNPSTHDPPPPPPLTHCLDGRSCFNISSLPSTG